MILIGSLAALWVPRCVQELFGRAPTQSFFGRVLAAVGGGASDPRQLLGKLRSEVSALDNLRQALHGGEGRAVPAAAPWSIG